jgi:hypothetical protein
MFGNLRRNRKNPAVGDYRDFADEPMMVANEAQM